MSSILYHLFNTLAFIFCFIPRRGHLWIAQSLGWVWFDILRFRRRIVLENLKKAFPTQTLAWHISIGRKSVQNLCLSFLDYFVLMRTTQKNLHKIVEFQDIQSLQAQFSKKEGNLLLSLHLGTIDLAPAGLALAGFPLSITLKKINNEAVNSFVERVRKEKKVHALADRKNPFEIFKAIKRGNLVVFVMDQYMGRPHGIEARFFGLPAGTASGLAAFSLKTQLPIVPIYNFRLANGKIAIRSEPAMPPEVISENFDENIRYNTQKYNDKMEELIKRHPDQWMWVHRRWKDFK